MHYHLCSATKDVFTNRGLDLVKRGWLDNDYFIDYSPNDSKGMLHNRLYRYIIRNLSEEDITALTLYGAQVLALPMDNLLARVPCDIYDAALDFSGMVK